MVGYSTHLYRKILSIQLSCLSIVNCQQWSSPTHTNFLFICISRANASRTSGTIPIPSPSSYSINRVIRKCFTCKLCNSQPAPPLLDPLPASRLKTHLPAFTNVGIDFFGLLSVVILKRSVERYGVMFTCLDTQGVHLEVADSLDMD